MSKENLIGIILILLITLVMLFYQSSYRVETERNLQPQAKTDTVANDSDKPIKKEIEPIDTTHYEEKLVYVRTDLYEATLSSRGGDIISFNLLKYKDYMGNPVELVRRRKDVPTYRIDANFSDGRITSEEMYLAPDRDTLILSESDSTMEVNFTGTLKNGAGIVRRYEFHYGSYIIHHHLVLVGHKENTINSMKLTLACGTLPTEKNPNAELRYFKGAVLYGDELIKKGLGGKPIEEHFDGVSRYAAVMSKYFALILAPEDKPADASFIYGQKDSLMVFGQILSLPHFQSGLIFNVNKEYFEENDILYFGPQDYFALRKYGRSFEKVVDLGWKTLRPIAVAFLFLFRKLYSVIPNYGVVIIIFSIFVKFLLHPLNIRMLRSMKKMKELEPKVRAIQAQYKDNPQKMNSELMRLYKEHGISPFSGCFPLLLQMPIFFALYQVLSYTIELRASPFILWIKDLSQKDPYIILPILMTITQFIQQKMTTKDPKQMAMVYIMPLVFFFIFMSFPAGLVLYWTTFNILSIITQYFYEKKYWAQEG